jgi:hypothetical protein
MNVSLLVVLSVLISLAVVAEAGATDKKRKAHKQLSAAPAAASRPPPDRYRELLADKMRVGSTDWWEQMRREGRLGGETP